MFASTLLELGKSGEAGEMGSGGDKETGAEE
jgi:hypothetical protein